MATNAWTTGQRYKWKGSFLHYEYEVREDKDQAALMNTAEQPFSTVVRQSLPTVIVNYYYNRLDHDVRADTVGRITNSAPMWGFAARTLRLHRWDFKQLTRNWYPPATPTVLTRDDFFVFELEFEINKATYDVVHQNFGTRFLKDAAQGNTPGGRYRYYTTKGTQDGTNDDESVVIPVSPLKLGVSGAFTGTGDAHRSLHEVFGEYDFTNLFSGGSADHKLPNAIGAAA